MIFALLTLLTALGLAAVAGWFSIIGVMAIFAAFPLHALIMGIALECGKLVTTSWLYRNWKTAGLGLKVPLIIFTITLMLATSMGVFGFLSKAHLEQGAATVDNTAKVERLDQQITREKSIIEDNNKVITQLDATINSYLGKDRADRSVSVRRAQAPQRKQLRDEIDAAQKRIDGFSDEKLKLQSEVRKLQLEVGPIRYIAELIYGTENSEKNIENAVRIFTLLIVSTFDPLAVILLIAANHSLMHLRRKEDEKIENTPDETVAEVSTPSTPVDLPVPETDKEEIRVVPVEISINEEKATLGESPISVDPEKNDGGTEPRDVQFSDQSNTSTGSDTPYAEAFENKAVQTLEVIDEDKEALVQNSLGDTESSSVQNTFEVQPSVPITTRQEDSDSTVEPEAVPTSLFDVNGWEGNEEKETSLEKFQYNSMFHSATPPAVILSPVISRVQEPVSKVISDPKPHVVQDSAILRELVGQHFIPVKINEEAITKELETSTDPSTGTSEIETGIQETIQMVGSGQEGNKEKEGSESEVKSRPKTYGWIKEFKRT